jgi:c-di-GMP-binding flagellar brake protein YcgR
MTEEKRKSPRRATDLIAQVTLLPERTHILGRLSNLSAGGALFRTADKAELGAAVTIRFKIPPIPPGFQFESEGIVIHSKDWNYMGIQFSDLPASATEMINNFVADDGS